MVASAPAMAPTVEELLRQARRQWPAVVVDDESFLAAVKRAATAGGAGPFDASAAAEIYLALGCAAGQAAALAAFEHAYLRDVAAVLARFAPTAVMLDEIKQRLRHRLLVAEPGETPKILRYAGRGLGQLVKVAAVRLAIDQTRARRGTDIDGLDVVATQRDPELLYMQRAYASVFKRAFEESINELGARARTLLRMHLVDGLGIDDVAVVYGIHRATAARQIDAAKKNVGRATRRRLREGGIDRLELEEAISLVSSHLELSIERVLRRQPDD
jgi:RNA polymerase sigma-70 factor, ECF subfamily